MTRDKILRRYVTESMRGLMTEIGKEGYLKASQASKDELMRRQKAWAEAEGAFQNAQRKLKDFQDVSGGHGSRAELMQKYDMSLGATTPAELSKKIATLLDPADNKAGSVAWYRKKIDDAGAAYKKAQAAYSVYDPEVIHYEKRKTKFGADRPPDKKAKRLMNIGQVKKLQWVPWPKKTLGIKFGSIGEVDSGVGPGEDRLAKVFGARVQGGGVSYDLVMPNGQKWEVKGLESSSATIRPGTEGIGAYDKQRARLETIMRQIKAFSNTAKELRLDVELENKKEAFIVTVVTDWIDDYYEKMVSRGEISEGDMHLFIKMVQYLQRLTAHRHEDPSKITGMDITLGDKKITVDRQTFIDVAKQLKKYDENIMEHIGALDIAIGHLTDPVFDNADMVAFLDEWASMTDVYEVFSQVDGLIVVNKELGFNVIPRSVFKNVLKFDKVTQGKPRFKFTAY